MVARLGLGTLVAMVRRDSQAPNANGNRQPSKTGASCSALADGNFTTNHAQRMLNLQPDKACLSLLLMGRRPSLH